MLGAWDRTGCSNGTSEIPAEPPRTAMNCFENSQSATVTSSLCYSVPYSAREMGGPIASFNLYFSDSTAVSMLCVNMKAISQLSPAN